MHAQNPFLELALVDDCEGRISISSAALFVYIYISRPYKSHKEVTFARTHVFITEYSFCFLPRVSPWSQKWTCAKVSWAVVRRCRCPCGRAGVLVWAATRPRWGFCTTFYQTGSSFCVSWVREPMVMVVRGCCCFPPPPSAIAWGLREKCFVIGCCCGYYCWVCRS